jgi:NADPH:quinone reductase-like Zn-dependent oxidoreductase
VTVEKPTSKPTSKPTNEKTGQIMSVVAAIGLSTFGGPEVLGVVEVPQPEPAPGQVRVRVAAAGVNPTDVTFRAGGRAQLLEGLPAPYVPGMDLAGTVDAVGEGVDRLHVGDEVVALVLPFAPTRGAYTTAIAVDQRSVVPAPAGASLHQAATVLLNGATANLALDALGLSAGDVLAVTGANGAVGSYAIEIAKERDLVVVADSRPGQHDAIRDRGADVVLDRGPGFSAALRDHFPAGANGLVDGAALNAGALPALADGATLASLKGWAGPGERDIRIESISSFGSVTDTALLERVSRLAGDGTLTLRVADVLPARDAAEAHRRLAAGGLDGRLVLDMTSLRR